jgi:GTP-binding protein
MPLSYFPNVSFVKSIVDLKDKPQPVLPEIAVVGRSNVGKSSLINSIFNQKKLAKVSSTPGKTRLINYFEVNNSFYFVDLPGYGFAKISKDESEKWKNMIESYLQFNSNLYLLLVLIDARRGIMNIDQSLLDWLLFYKINYKMVLTKIDKLSGNELAKIKSKIIKQIKDKNPILFSNQSEKGRINLINYLKMQLNELSIVSN